MRIKVILISVLFITLYACNWIKPKVKIPDLPYLKSDTINRFKIGERFTISEGHNSCCMYCFEKDTVLSEEITLPAFLKVVETIEDPADPDCAGCSSYFYTIIECVSGGIDTIQYHTIPMGATGAASDCSELNKELVKTEASSFTYVISVHN
ncbi:MAG: hypothetical protein POELPBGB_02572 [Bacteroidia bacterium]|nr:hypothetical protein [Bacteroidia bacterium]